MILIAILTLSAPSRFSAKKKKKKNLKKFYSYFSFYAREKKILSSVFSQLIELFDRTIKKKKKKKIQLNMNYSYPNP